MSRRVDAMLWNFLSPFTVSTCCGTVESLMLTADAKYIIEEQDSLLLWVELKLC